MGNLTKRGERSYTGHSDTCNRSAHRNDPGAPEETTDGSQRGTGSGGAGRFGRLGRHHPHRWGCRCRGRCQAPRRSDRRRVPVVPRARIPHPTVPPDRPHPFLVPPGGRRLGLGRRLHRRFGRCGRALQELPGQRRFRCRTVGRPPPGPQLAAGPRDAPARHRGRSRHGSGHRTPGGRRGPPSRRAGHRESPGRSLSGPGGQPPGRPRPTWWSDADNAVAIRLYAARLGSSPVRSSSCMPAHPRLSCSGNGPPRECGRSSPSSPSW